MTTCYRGKCTRLDQLREGLDLVIPTNLWRHVRPDRQSGRFLVGPLWVPGRMFFLGFLRYPLDSSQGSRQSILVTVERGRA